MQTPPQKDSVLLIDDEPMILDLVGEWIESMGCNVLKATCLKDGRKILKETSSVSLILCDQRLPDGDGLSFFQELKTSHPSIVRILITGFPDTKVALASINDGEIFRFIVKPCEPEDVSSAVREALDRYRLKEENKNLHQALVAGNEELKRANESLQQALSNSVKVCLDVLDRFDHVLAGHSDRVAKWAVAIGKTFSLSERDLDTLELAAQTHDIGLISVSKSFHRQQQIGWEDLSPSQQTSLHSHTKTGAELIQFLSQKKVPEVVLAHHEWYNGNGYPLHLERDQIPFLASILAVPDAYDELPMDRDQAAKFIQDHLGSRFHPEVGRAFLRLLAERPEYSQQEKEVLISELRGDMKLTCNLLSATGILLVPKGQILTSKLIQYIRQHDQSEPLTQRIFVAS